MWDLSIIKRDFSALILHALTGQGKFTQISYYGDQKEVLPNNSSTFKEDMTSEVK